MALNYSHRPIFPTRMSEDNYVAPMRVVDGYFVQGILEKSGEGFVRSRNVNPDVDDDFGYGRDKIDRRGSPDDVPKDIVDLLPSDPFGMDINTTVTAITGWLEDLEVGYGGSFPGGSREDYGLLNLFWNNLQSFSENVLFDNKPAFQMYQCVDGRRVGDVLGKTGFAFLNNSKDNIEYGSASTSSRKDNDIMGFRSLSGNVFLDNKLSCQMDRYADRRIFGDAFNMADFRPATNIKDYIDFENKSNNASDVSQQNVELLLDVRLNSSRDGEAPHGALSFALLYLGVDVLLSVERVCKSLHFEVQNDPLLWRKIHIDKPLSERITNEHLLQLASRAQGNLQCLSLVECTRITDDCLRRIFEANPRLTTLCVPGCTRLSVDGIVNILKAFKCKRGTQGIKHLRIGGLHGVTYEHFHELNALLGANGHDQRSVHRPHFYLRGSFYVLSDDDRAIDIEKCPRCQKVRLIYDCPSEACQTKGHCVTQGCRACTLCIARCVQCGRCVNDREYEETFCLEYVCSDCFKPHAS